MPFDGNKLLRSLCPIYTFLCRRPGYKQWALFLHVYIHTLFNNLLLGGWGLVLSEVSGILPFRVSGPHTDLNLMNRGSMVYMNLALSLCTSYLFSSFSIYWALTVWQELFQVASINSYNWEGNNRLPKPQLAFLKEMEAKEVRDPNQNDRVFPDTPLPCAPHMSHWIHSTSEMETGKSF